MTYFQSERKNSLIEHIWLSIADIQMIPNIVLFPRIPMASHLFNVKLNLIKAKLKVFGLKFLNGFKAIHSQQLLILKIRSKWNQSLKREFFHRMETLTLKIQRISCNEVYAA